MRRIVRADLLLYLYFHFTLYLNTFHPSCTISSHTHPQVNHLPQTISKSLIKITKSSQEIKIRRFLNIAKFADSNTFGANFGSVTQLNINIQKTQLSSMNSYQSTIDTESDTDSKKYQYHLEKTTALRRTSKRIKRNRNPKIQNSSSKIQIQDSYPQAQNFNSQVRTYAKDIINHVSNTQLDSVISQNYMQWQTDINSHMREILVGWLIQVSSGLNLRPQTLHLAVLLVDKYCYARSILKKKYQVLGGACLYIAAKYEEIVTPKLKKYVDISDKSYTAAELLHMQSEVLLTLNFKIQQKSTLTFYQIKSEEYGVPKSVLGLGYLLLQMCLVEFEFCRKKPTQLSLAILYTAMKLKKSKNCPTTSKKVFAAQNCLDEELFSKYVSYIEVLFNIRYLPKFSPVRKRYGVLFTPEGELK